MRAYHFTAWSRLVAIAHDQKIKTTESNVSLAYEHAGPDVVWLLDTPDLGGHDHGLNPGAVRDHKGAIRITVDLPDYKVCRWVEWDPARRDPRTSLILIEGGGGPDAADHWLVTEAIIRADRWLSIEDVETGEVLWRAGDSLADVEQVARDRCAELGLRMDSEGHIMGLRLMKKGWLPH